MILGRQNNVNQSGADQKLRSLICEWQWNGISLQQGLKALGWRRMHKHTYTHTKLQGLDPHKREMSHTVKHTEISTNCCIIAKTHTCELSGFLSLASTHMLQFVHPPQVPALQFTAKTVSSGAVNNENLIWNSKQNKSFAKAFIILKPDGRGLDGDDGSGSGGGTEKLPEKWVSKQLWRQCLLWKGIYCIFINVLPNCLVFHLHFLKKHGKKFWFR